MSHACRRFNRKLFCLRNMLRRLVHCKLRYDSPSVRMLGIVVGLVTLLFVGHLFFNQTDYEIRSHIFCFRSKTESLADISLDVPLPDRSFFFVDTSCISHLKNRIFLPTRQVCVIEAAARLHPKWDVYVLFGSPGVFKYDGRSRGDRALRVLLNYENIKLHHIDYGTFLTGTPLEAFVKDGIPYDSPHSQFQANHILRTAALWKYGGVALDLNMLLLKNIELLSKNFIGRDKDGFGNDVMKITSTPTGKKILSFLVQQMKTGYIPEVWNSLGSKSLTKAIQKRCPFRGNKSITYCEFLKIYPKKTFYPSEMVEWLDFFRDGDYRMLSVVNGSYAIRNWNIHTGSSVTGHMAYGIIAKRVCPKTFSISEGMFG